MGLATIDSHSQKEHTEIHKIRKFGVNLASFHWDFKLTYIPFSVFCAFVCSDQWASRLVVIVYAALITGANIRKKMKATHLLVYIRERIVYRFEAARVGTGSVTWLRPERLRRRLVVQRIAGLGSPLKKHAQFVAFYWFPLAKIVRALISERLVNPRKGKWPTVRIIVGIPNMLLIAAQAVKLLDLPRFPPRPAKSIQSKLNGGRNRNMLKIGGILPTHVTRLKRKSARRIRLQNRR